MQRIEDGKRFVTDIELLSFSRLFNVSTDQLLETDNFRVKKEELI